ncbi:MAG: translation initiation factor IF-2 [bacterium]
MRVYELAKKLQASSVEVLKQASVLGLEADSVLAQLEPSETKQLQDAFAKRGSDLGQEQVALTTRLEEKRSKAASAGREALKAESDALERNRTRANEMDARKKGTLGSAVKSASSVAAPEPVKTLVQLEVAETKAAEAKGIPVVAEAKAPTVAFAEKVHPPVVPTPIKDHSAQEKVEEPEQNDSESVAGKQSAKKVKPLKAKAGPYVVEEELEPEEALAAQFIERIAKPESSKILRSPPPKSVGEVESKRQPPPRGVQPFQAPRSGPQAQQRGPLGSQQNGFQQGQPQRNGQSPFPQRGPQGVPLRNGMRPVQATSPAPVQETAPDRIIMLRGAIMVKDLAEQLGLRPNRLIADLMQLNILASINQRVEIDVAQKITEKYGYKIEIERQKRSTERKPILRSEDADDAIPDDKPEELVTRPPVVTFLGHVDHGKTSLMDRIRNTRVAMGEAGGITQHIGAYTVEVSGRKITFLDTPGHAAFSSMRARGASLTDIAVIIIAADDGIMPQTREVIKQAQQAGVQILIAINKCDLPSAKPDRVRQMLQGEGLTPEEWGGDVICTEVSAVTGAGVDHLLEMILLQADVLELMANPSRRADGYVVEAQLEQGLGPTATLLVAGGTINVGDIILCGEHFGRIRGLIDDRGRRVKSAGPATAVRCMGLSGVPEAGASFRVMLNEKRARELAERLSEERKQTELVSAKATSLDALMSQMKESQKRELAVIVKADTQGSAEAIVEALREIKSEKVTLNIVTSSIGNVSATDINKAGAGKAIVLGFSVACETGVQQQARHDGVRVSTFRIIYELLDFVKQRMLDLLPPEYKEAVRGHAEIKVAFDIGKTGRVAGCQMLDGVLRPDARYRIFRKKEKIWDGKISSLKHFQNEVSEVTGSQECGIFFNGYEEFQVGDLVECYVLEELPRTL